MKLVEQMKLGQPGRMNSARTSLYCLPPCNFHLPPIPFSRRLPLAHMKRQGVNRREIRRCLSGKMSSHFGELSESAEHAWNSMKFCNRKTGGHELYFLGNLCI